MVEAKLCWIKSKVLTILGDENEAIFCDIFEEIDVKKRLLDFIQSDKGEKSAIFYKTHQEKTIEHQVVVPTKVTCTRFSLLEKDISSDENSDSPPLPVAPPPSAANKSKQKSPGTTKKGKTVNPRGSLDAKSGKRTSISSAKDGKKGRKSPSTVVETMSDADEEKETQESQDEEIPSVKQEVTYTTRVDQEVVFVPVLHCTFGTLSKEEQKMRDTTFVMFIKNDADFILLTFSAPFVPTVALFIQKVFHTMLEDSTFYIDHRVSRSSSKSTSFDPNFKNKQSGSCSNLVQEIESTIKWLLNHDEVENPFKLPSETGKQIDLKPYLATWLQQIQDKLAHINKLELVARHIDVVATNSSRVVSGGDGPICEVTSWEEKESALSLLSCHLSLVSTLLQSNPEPDSDRVRNLIDYTQEKLTESRAVTTSLQPASVYFKELSISSSLVGMRHVLVQLMAGLRNIWTICTAYAQHDHMEHLLQQVAALMCQKVAARLSMDTFFKQGVERALLKAKQASKLLKTWKNIYFQTRQEIETSGHCPRWDFNCKKLFGDSEYIREVCNDLAQVCQTILEFRSVLSPHLRRVLTDSSGVETLRRSINSLISPIQEDSDFEVFDSSSADSWRSFMNHFKRSVIVLEQQTCAFFQQNLAPANTSTSNEMLDLLMMYCGIETRETLQNIILTKFEVVMQLFSSEVNQVSIYFCLHKNCSPLLRNQPQKPGAISWSRLMFTSLKSKAVLFKDVDRLGSANSALGSYILLSRQIKSYQDEHFSEWTKQTEDTIEALISSNIITVIKKPSRRSVSAVERRLGKLYAPPESRTVRSSSESSRTLLRPVLASLRWVARAIAAKKRASLASESSLVVPIVDLKSTSQSLASLGLQYDVSYNYSTTAEAKVIENLGLIFTRKIRLHATSHATVFPSYKNIKHTVNKINSSICKLDEAEILVLHLPLKYVERRINPGVVRLKWISSGLSEFSETCDESSIFLDTFINQLNLFSEQAYQYITIIRNYNLFYMPENNGILHCKAFFSYVEIVRKKRLNKIVETYDNFRASLLCLEKWTTKSTTGRNERISKYYLQWEQKLYEAIVSMTVKNLDLFLFILNGRKLYFQVDAELNEPELCLNPSPEETYHLIVDNISALILGLEVIPRWKSGSCFPCERTNVTGSKTYSILDDLRQVELIKAKFLLIKETLQNLLCKTKHAVSRWRKYEFLWQFSKKGTCTNFKDKNPSFDENDEKLIYFSNLIKKIDSSPEEINIACIHLNLKPLKEKVRGHAVSWLNCIAGDIVSSAKKEMNIFIADCWKTKYELNRMKNSENIETLKHCLKLINQIRQSHTQNELKSHQIEESLRMVTLYGANVDSKLYTMAKGLWPLWDSIYLNSLQQLETMTELKKQYCITANSSLQEFYNSCNDFVERLLSEGPGTIIDDLDHGLTLMGEFSLQLDKLKVKKREVLEDEILFDMISETDSNKLELAETHMNLLQQVFTIYNNKKVLRNLWFPTLWHEITVTKIEQDLEEILQNFNNLPSEAQDLPVALTLKTMIEEFHASLPLLNLLKSASLKERHWQFIIDKSEVKLQTSFVNLNFESVYLVGRSVGLAEVERTEEIARREQEVEKVLNDIKQEWHGRELPLQEYPGEGYILGSTTEIFTLLDDHSAALKMLMTQKHIGSFLDNMLYWEVNLSQIEETLSVWKSTQDSWLELTCLLEARDYIGSEFHQKMDTCYKKYVTLMTEVAMKNQVITVCCNAQIVADISAVNNQLQQCHQILTTFFSQMRAQFPRFYFLTEQEILKLFGPDQLQCVHQQIRKMKLLPDVSSLDILNEIGNEVIVRGITSPDGETLSLQLPLNITYLRVEQWLSQLIESIKRTLKLRIKHTIHSESDHLLLTHPNMVAIVTSQIWFVQQIENIFRNSKSSNMLKLMSEINLQIKEWSQLLTNTELSKLDVKKITSSLLLFIHFQRVVEKLQQNCVSSEQDFLWESQLRFYFHQDLVKIQHSCSTTDYGYEFIGIHNNLINTSQTDRVFLTISQALSLHLGVMLCGKSGSGKTETLTDMARSLGTICYIMQCTSLVNWTVMGYVLTGLIQCGFWGCLEHMDLLDKSALSVLSSQLFIIRSAVIMSVATFNFNQQEIHLDPKFAILATINPYDKDRNKIPQSLRSGFRPVYFSTPDIQQICYVWLKINGFQSAKVHAKKISKMCEFFNEEFSTQSHYNFGLCQIKTILKLTLNKSPHSSEDQVIYNSILTAVSPTLVPDDVTTFQELLKEMYPRLEFKTEESNNLNPIIESVLTKANCMILPSQMNKMINVLNALQLNSAAMLIGNSGAGKTVISNVIANYYLNETAEADGQSKKGIYRLYPNSQTPTTFFGDYDTQTKLWSDGIFTNIVRKASNNEQEVIIILDGSAIWIEQICSIWENNVLSICNGEKIPTLGNCKIIFETENLKFHSPLIISKLNTIYINTDENIHDATWHRWTHNKNQKSSLDKLYEKFVALILNKISSCLMITVLPFSPLNMVNQLCYVLDMLIPENTDSILCYFIEALYLSLGATIDVEFRDAFDMYVKHVSGLKLVDDSQDSPCQFEELPKNSLFDYFWNEKAWMNWAWDIPCQQDTQEIISEKIVLNSITRKMFHLLKNVIRVNFQDSIFQKINRPLFIVGPTGSSKSLLIQHFMKILNEETYLPQTLALSTNITAGQVQTCINGVMRKRTNRVLDTLNGKKVVLFIDDINMPKERCKDEPLEFLRMVFEQSGYYMQGNDLSWKNLNNIGFVGAVTLPCTISPRLTSQVCVVYMPQPSHHVLEQVFLNIVDAHLHTFPPQIKNLSEALVAASMALYAEIVSKLPPIPDRWASQVCSRDVMKLVDGVCKSAPCHFSNPQTFLRLWRHEAERVFVDRFGDKQDQETAKSIITSTVALYFGPYHDHVLRNPILFGDFRNALCEKTRYYEDLLDYEAVFFLFQEVLEHLNGRQRKAKLDLVLFDTALEHLVRVHRVLRTLEGHAVLIGEAGMGRKCLLQVAAAAAHCTIVKLPHTAHGLQERLRQVFIRMGVTHETVALLVEEEHMEINGFPEMLHHLLTTSFIAGLFENNDEIIDQILSNRQLSSDREAVWLQFQRDCVSRLHVVLVISAQSLKRFSKIYPCLITNTSLDWFEAWSTQAMLKVAKHFIDNNAMISEMQKIPVKDLSVSIYTSACKFYKMVDLNVTSSPWLYIHFLNTFTKVLKANVISKNTTISQLSQALARVCEARTLLANLQEQYSANRDKLKKQTEETDKLKLIIGTELEDNKKRGEVAAEWLRNAERHKKTVSSEKFQLEEIQNSAEKEMQNARNLLQNLQECELQQLRSEEPVSESTLIVCNCALLLVNGQREGDAWEIAKSQLLQTDALERLSELKCENITFKQVRMIKLQLKKLSPSMSDSSNVVNALLHFTQAIIKFYITLKDLKPRSDMIANLEQELTQMLSCASSAMAEVEHGEKVIQKLNEELTEAVGENSKTQQTNLSIEMQLETAQTLVLNLGEEEKRWSHCLSEEELSLKKLAGDCLLLSAMLCYAGPLRGPSLRTMALQDWLKTLQESGISVSTSLQLQNLLQQFAPSKRLPPGIFDDDTSLQSFVAMTTSINKFSLCIDPQQQAIDWLHCTCDNLLETSVNDHEMMDKIKRAASQGWSVIIHDVTSGLSPSLYSVLDKKIISVDKQSFIEIEDELFPYQLTFQIYLNTRQGRPQLEPLVYIKTTVVDCTITPHMLERCLLLDVIKIEEPELFEKLENCSKQISRQEDQLEQLGATIVQTVNSANLELILLFSEQIQQFRTQYSQVLAELAENKSVQEMTKLANEKYRRITERAALVFSVLVDLANVSSSYQFSLNTFRQLLQNSLSDKTQDVCAALTRNTYSFVCRGLYTQHQLCFTLSLLLRLEVSRGIISPREPRLLSTLCKLKHGTSSQHGWLSFQGQQNAQLLAHELPTIFGSLVDDLQDEAWKQWIEMECPEKTPFPCTYSAKLTSFQTILLLCCLRKDRVIPAIQIYIEQNLGEFFTTPIIPSMRALLAESDSHTPVLLLLGPGADPSMELHRLSKQCGRDSGQIVTLALGIGLEQKAQEVLKSAARRGQWLLLLNCHLAVSVLAHIWATLDNQPVHQDFRLWLTSDHSADLPTNLLHSALKVVLEVPKGLKLKLNNTFRKVEVCKSDHPCFMRLLYVLTYFHATLQERSEYTSGWNSNYNFSKCDFDAGVSILQKCLEKCDKNSVPWETIKSLIGKVIYGGHMNDCYDKRVVDTYLQEFCGQFIFSSKFRFFQDETSNYSFPAFFNSFGILAHIQSLPLGNSCVVLGLNTNAELHHNEKILQELVQQFSLLRPQYEIEESIPRLKNEELVALVHDILAQVPPGIDITSATHAHQSYIRQEIKSYNKLKMTIVSTLTSLEQALLGKAKMLRDLEDTLVCLIDGRVPLSWRRLSPETNKSLGSWLSHLSQRHQQYYNWVMKHVPLVVWLPGLNSPTSFLRHILKTACRRNHWALETAGLDYVITRRPQLPAIPDGAYIQGLHIENAEWNQATNCLKPAISGHLSAAFPIVAVVALENDPKQLPHTVRTPVYACRRRQGEEFRETICELNLPCSDHPSEWLLRGVQLVLDPD